MYYLADFKCRLDPRGYIDACSYCVSVFSGKLLFFVPIFLCIVSCVSRMKWILSSDQFLTDDLNEGSAFFSSVSIGEVRLECDFFSLILNHILCVPSIASYKFEGC